VGSLTKNVGAPPKYTSSEQIEGLIDAYFERCNGQMLRDEIGSLIFDKQGLPIIINAKPPTVTGLALALGFTTRKSLLTYQGKKEFMNTITRAKSRVEEYVEGRLDTRDGARGAEFSLRCNFGWKTDSDDGNAEVLNKVKSLLDGVQSAI